MRLPPCRTRTSPPANGVPVALSATVPPMSPTRASNDVSRVTKCMTLSWLRSAHTSPSGVVKRELTCWIPVAAEARRRYSGERRRSAGIGKSEISGKRRALHDCGRPFEALPFANPNDSRGIARERRREKTMECAIGRMDAGAAGGRVRLDVRRTGRLAESGIGPRGGRRHAELEQREEEKRRPHPQRAFPHRRHITRYDPVLTASVTLP